jgi:hypothetical protein
LLHHSLCPPRQTPPSPTFLNLAPLPRKAGGTNNRFELVLGNPQKIRSLEEALRHERAAHQTAERELAHEKAKSGDLTRQLEELNQAFALLKEDVGTVEKDATQCAAEVARLKTLLKKTEEKFVHEQEARNELVKELRTAKLREQAADQEIADLKKQLTTAQGQLTDHLTYREASIKELTRIKALALQLEKEKADQAEELDRRLHRIQELEAPPQQDVDEPLPMPEDDNGPVDMMMPSEESDLDPSEQDEPGSEVVTECAWWAKYADRPTAKPCYGEIATLGHHFHGELKLCARHVCTMRGPGCRLMARPVGFKCGACSRTEEGKERIKDYDFDRSRRRPRGHR